jgi:hypothetical protein
MDVEAEYEVEEEEEKTHATNVCFSDYQIESRI